MSKIVVGLTGGVATGKSLVSEEFKRLGAPVIDADAVAREVTAKGEDVYNGIVEEFGPSILAPDGSIDRRRLGRIVFADQSKLALLNRLTHPEILKRIRGRVESLKDQGGNPIIVINAALLIETGLHREVDRVVVVHAAEDKQLSRTVLRDSISVEEARRRIASQMPLEEKMAMADHLIDNNGTIVEAENEARRLYIELAEEARNGS
jgi:dephospho-CoA kinase